MKVRTLVLAGGALLLAAITGCQPALVDTHTHTWAVHDMNRPLPEVIRPGAESTQQEAGRAPSDAIVLFDGTDLSEWVSDKAGAAPKWKVENGYMEIARRTGSIQTKRAFGNCQLHIEWTTPAQVKGSGQGRGNSGVFLMGKYEVQVLDSYDNTTYADGQAASIYGQSPPMVNACRPPGQWQSFDIIFHRPIFDGKKLVKPATITLLHNGVLVQNNWVLEGLTLHKKRAEYVPHEDKLPLTLQDHGDPVRYRNIWIRELPESR